MVQFEVLSQIFDRYCTHYLGTKVLFVAHCFVTRLGEFPTTIISYRIIFLARLLYPIVCSDIFRYSRWMFAFLSRIKIINWMSLEEINLCMFLLETRYLNFNINSLYLKTALWNISVFSSLQRIDL